MNNPRKLAMSIAAALYAAGAGIASATATAPTLQPMPDFIKEVKITEEMLHASSQRRERADRFNHGQTTAISGIHQTNVSRAIPTGVDFKWDNEVTGVNTYIIEFHDQPVALYDGRVSGLNATRSRDLSRVPSSLATTDSYKINPNSPDVVKYREYLSEKQQSMIAEVQAVVGHDIAPREVFQFALNGTSMAMTQQQALQVSKMPGVRNVSISKSYDLNTDVGPKHIGADQIWIPNTLALANKGEGVVVGIIDTGINSDHPAFAAIAGDGYVHTNPRGQYYGDCEKEEFAHMCNDKLIGVRSYDVITDTYWSPAYQSEFGYWETPPTPIRPENGEDYQGHGSHTASTAAGNELFDVPYTMAEFAEQSDGITTELVFPHTSGVAPRANIIAYHVCYANDGSLGDMNSPTDQWQGCPGEAIMAAIEDAIQDNVDVINFSIGGGESSPWESPMEMAFLAAREAGISAALSAGNSGEAVVDHVSPWLTSVAATTHGREINFSEKTLGDFSGGDPAMQAPGYGSPLVGAGYTEGFTGNIVLAANYGDGLCNSPFAADTFTSDQIVVCKRGDIARVQKAVNVQAGGAGGFVLYNADYTQDAPYGYSEPMDPYVIPGILLKSSVNYDLIPWLQQGTGHMATINASTIDVAMNDGDYVADFSSRGPSKTTPDSMVPNVGAPGVDVYAANADDMPFTVSPMTSDYTLMSGTSMAAPHVAGAMALLTQLHPDWTPAEIQSALMMTAGSGTSIDAQGWNIETANVDDFGSGIINVERASRAGLVMDETGVNYRAADPNNGGNLPSLNEAYLFNTNCEFDCNWVRTFRATEDGTWNLKMEGNEEDGLPLVDMSVSPATFSLKKGEVQSVIFRASASDIGNVFGSIADYTFEGKVTIAAEDDGMAEQHMPVRVSFADDGLPNDLSIDIHRSMGSALSSRLYTKEVGHVEAHGLIKGQTQVHSLVPYTLGMGTPEDIAADPGIEQVNFTIPEGTKRFVFEIIKQEGYTISHDTAIDIGRDVNGDGLAQWYEEAICFSFSYARDWCAIDNPEPGEYWALVGNYSLYDPNFDQFGVGEPLTLTTSLAIIPEGADGTLTAEVVGNANGIDGYYVDLGWDIEGVAQGDVYYAAIEFGRDAANSGDVGMMGVRFEHQGDDVFLMASQTSGKVGDVIDYHLEAKPNMTQSDRGFTLQTVVPEGLNLSHESVTVEGAYADMTMVEGNTITISGVQQTSAFVPRQYVWTTSETDPLCRMPYQDTDYKDNYYDLSYIMQPTIIEGGSWDTFFLETWQLGFDNITHYGQEWNGIMGINPAGFFQVDAQYYMNPSHSAMEWVYFPDTMIAPLWHGSASTTAGFDWMTGMSNGVFVATTINEELMVQWNGMMVNDWWTGVSGSYNVQTIFKTQPDYNEGQYEVLFGYEKLDPALNGQGAIGTRGYHGHRNPWAPNEGWNADTFAINNVLDRTAENMLVCGDYRGPEQSSIRVAFSAVVINDASGSDQQVVVTSDYDNAEQLVVTSNTMVNGNITVGQFNDVTINENDMIEGLVVAYAAMNSTEKVISVMGDNVSGTVHGHTAGSMVDIMPDTNWHGTTEVTIKVADATNANDYAMSSFMLTVMSDGIELGCTDTSATNFDANANQDDGSCTYPAAEAPVDVQSSGSSSGALHWLLMTMLAVFVFRKTAK